jgi:hypothetical protein
VRLAENLDPETKARIAEMKAEREGQLVARERVAEMAEEMAQERLVALKAEHGLAV